MGLSVLIVGCGDLGNLLGQRLLLAGHSVYGLRRNIAQLSPGIQPIAFDLSDLVDRPQLPEVDLLIYTAAAKSRDIETYRRIYVDAPLHILSALKRPPQRIIHIGSTGVYGQDQHEWIDEQTEATPNNPFGEALLEGELKLSAEGIPVTIARCSGIYGPGRNHLINRVRAGISAFKEPVHYSNRIHSSDAAGFLAHLIEMEEHGQRLAPLYLLSDDLPSPISEITDWLAEQLGTEVTQRERIARGGSKRIKNELMKSTGYVLEYPDFKAGFAQAISASR